MKKMIAIHEHTITNNILKIKSEIALHHHQECTLVAVSKTRPLEEIIIAYEGAAGQRHFGENRLKELEQKAQSIALNKKQSEIAWHFIGNLQSNKIRPLLKIPQLNFIHSIDSIKLLELLYEHTLQETPLYYFLQVNTSGEGEKGGFKSYQDLLVACEWITQHQKLRPQLHFHGLMTMGRIRTSDVLADAHHSFQMLQEYRDQLTTRAGHPLHLSMGMSQDYPVALQYGSSYLRIGSTIFS
ncbi:MAG: YggS family pyridoxal phosphate-dependent enzyme [Oligoflexia bacterium]|nr:YggS family pyridoxal phosphate-dependent enzyme [Oligoflexia bacterium]MBF0365505.1 YggS family pyridoxal phosphate-dependent enzyme [Oligoflexia bacterium]